MSSDSGNHNADRVEHAANGEDSVHLELGRLERELESARAELRLEAALDRVRTRAMSMVSSEDIGATTLLLFDEIKAFCPNIIRAGIAVVKSQNEFQPWVVGLDDDGRRILMRGINVKRGDRSELDSAVDAWSEGKGYCFKESKEFLQWVVEVLYKGDSVQIIEVDVPHDQYLSTIIHKTGFLFVVSDHPVTKDSEEGRIVSRFAGAYDVAYQRYLDLRQAEVQIRQAQIGIAVERVQARALAMHKSEDILDVVITLRNEMLGLDLSGVSAATIYLQQADGLVRVADITHVEKSESSNPFTSEAVFDPKNVSRKLFPNRIWRAKGDYEIIELDDADLYAGAAWAREYDEKSSDELIKLLDSGVLTELWISTVPLEHGKLCVDFMEPPPEEMRSILPRMGAAFDLAYTRFDDLKQAEAQAREARLEASLERVRGRAMAMQKPEDLGDVSILMFDELAALGIESLRSGISLPLDDERYEFHAATNKDDGTTTLVVGNESTNVHPIIRRAYDGYREQEEFQKTILKGNNLVEYYHAVFDTMPLPDWKERMEIGAEAQEGFATFPFSDGWLYTFTREEMDDEQIGVYVRFAKAFGLAYQRYHDLTQAEQDYKALLDEKARTEKTLEELHATQAQLIEQEKLASLGALTAGIAHEIKNPLNFVNNFAEVSTELVEELSEAVTAGNADEAQSLLGEISENAKQIAKHGKRADSIVKAMMQHARGGASDPESVDVNEFVEEYVNLSWHGMRAKNHEFQTEVVRNYDETAGAITIQPQEMGRVLLNILNNAFDALKGMVPAQVTVTTRRADSSVEITISDNGPGIPEELREKIFEPFFTTKATGEGTGLGLSLSYDIVTKGHGGTMAVESATGEGAAFKITLPA